MSVENRSPKNDQGIDRLHQVNDRLKGVTSKFDEGFKIIAVYIMWFIDLGLATWLLFNTRLVLIVIPAWLFDSNDYFYPKRVETTDKFFTLLLGIGWLVFMVITEEYFRRGAQKGKLTQRFATITGVVLLSIFVVGLILFGLQGFQGEGYQWLLLLAELVVGLLLLLYGRKKSAIPPS